MPECHFRLLRTPGKDHCPAGNDTGELDGSNSLISKGATYLSQLPAVLLIAFP